jgi:hypothetical protein
MRLLNARTYELEEYNENAVPPYAILSHTWEDGEVLFKDVIGGNYSHLAGFQKIEYACDQAMVDGLEHVWVDTCNIDKSSSAELSEAINSMFRYYQKAVVCYVYLSDLHESKDGLEDCKWFARGWTLQELLAPKSVRFFTAEWKDIGSRSNLIPQISRRTKIPEPALAGDVEIVRTYSIAQRMSWASGRQTTRPEDIAYSLFGLFDCAMPLIYGEGHKAFARLQEEIMKRSNDQSLFLWHASTFTAVAGREAGKSAGGTKYCTLVSDRRSILFEQGRLTEHGHLFARTPADFEACGSIVHWAVGTENYTLTNAGLHISGRLLALTSKPFGGSHVLIFQCYDETSPLQRLGILLARASESENLYVRAASAICRFATEDDHEIPRSSIYISRESFPQPSPQVRQLTGMILSFRLSYSPARFRLVDIFPSAFVRRDTARAEPEKLSRLSSEAWQKCFKDGSWIAVILLSVVRGPLRKLYDAGESGGAAFSLLLGYNRHEDNCLVHLAPDMMDVEALCRAMEFPATMPTSRLNKHSIDMSRAGWFGGSVSVSLTKGSGKSISRHWDGTPIQVRLDDGKREAADGHTTVRIGVGGHNHDHLP